MKNILAPLFKIESMSSLEISELTGKKHFNVLRDIRAMLAELYQFEGGDSELNHKDIQGVKVERDDRNYIVKVNLDKSHTFTLVTGYSFELRKMVVDRWQYLEEQLNILKFREGDKKNQLNAMEALSHLLPDDLKDEALSYIKANTVVNKAVSNLFGFPKMLKKDEMSPDMLTVREKVLDDYIKLYDVIADNAKIKDILYNKYQPMRLECQRQAA